MFVGVYERWRIVKIGSLVHVILYSHLTTHSFCVQLSNMPILLNCTLIGTLNRRQSLEEDERRSHQIYSRSQKLREGYYGAPLTPQHSPSHRATRLIGKNYLVLLGRN